VVRTHLLCARLRYVCVVCPPCCALRQT
jgi:hypothetical protein